MKFAHFFIERPVFAGVLSIVTIIIGAIAIFTLPIAQYPEIAPPTVTVTASYAGANAKTVAETVATPIEEQINGVEGMIYMSSQSTNDGNMALTITFKLGTNLDIAQVQVQNRVAIAQPVLPQDVQRAGIVVKKASPDITLGMAIYSPDGSRDPLYLSNYTTLQIKDELARLPGVGDLKVFGARDYSMRLWLNPEQLASRNLTAGASGGRHCGRTTAAQGAGTVSIHGQCTGTLGRAQRVRRDHLKNRNRWQRHKIERCLAHRTRRCRLHHQHPLRR
jgi:multidrug efflux pump